MKILKHPAAVALILCALAWVIVVAVALTNDPEEGIPTAPAGAPTTSYTDCWPHPSGEPRQ